MNAKEILWNYFASTGEIGSYLLLKGIEQADDGKYNKYRGESLDNERISVERGDNFKNPRLQGRR